MSLIIQTFLIIMAIYLLVRLVLFGRFLFDRTRARRKGDPDPARQVPFEILAWTAILFFMGTGLTVLFSNFAG